MFRIALLSGLLFLSVLAQASSDENGTLVGRGLKVLWKDHHLIGVVGRSRLRAEPLKNEFGLKLTHEMGGRTFESIFRKGEKGFAAAVKGLDAKGKERQVVFALTAVDGQKGLIHGTLNGHRFVVQVSADKMNGHHFVEPTFSVRLENRSYQFKLKDGQACMGCAVKISFALLTTSLLNGLW